jgi:hypothetical protein
MVPGKDPTVLINAVVPDEPDGYRGRRRRLFLTRRAGGAALPILLVAASVVVVLIVVGVSQLLPHQAAGQIPVGSGGTVSGDNGQVQADASDGGSAGASASVPPSRSPSVKPSAIASGGVSPSAAPGAPTRPGAAPPPFGPVAIEAEAGVLSGAAYAGDCSSCSGGKRVRNIGNGSGNAVTFNGVNAPVPGTYQLTITYVLGEPTRDFYISVNGGGAARVTARSSTTDWAVQQTLTTSITLAGGANSIKFTNPGAYAPDLDKISIH